jgi:hypothetical protein
LLAALIGHVPDAVSAYLMATMPASSRTVYPSVGRTVRVYAADF